MMALINITLDYISVTVERIPRNLA